MKNDINQKKYPVMYMVITLVICWGLGILYTIFSNGFSASFSDPAVLVAMCAPTLAALIIYGITGGKPTIKNILKKFLIRREQLFWIPVIISLNLLFFLIVRFGLILLGIEVPEITLTLNQQLKEMIINFFEEIGVIGGAMGWVGFLIPYFQTKFNNNIKAGIMAGLGIGLFVIPGYAISAFGLVALYPLYVLQMVTFMVLYSYIFNLTDGNLMLYVILLWVNSSGSRMQLYYFAPPSQILQTGAFALAAFGFHMLTRNKIKMELVKLPQYFLEVSKTVELRGKNIGTIYENEGR